MNNNKDIFKGHKLMCPDCKVMLKCTQQNFLRHEATNKHKKNKTLKDEFTKEFGVDPFVKEIDDLIYNLLVTKNYD